MAGSRSRAEYQRRYRRHRKGDHSLCLPASCPVLAAENAVEAGKPPEEPAGSDRSRPRPVLNELGLGENGRKLYEAVTASSARITPLQVPLLLEACRITDRLDSLDRQLHGGDWLRLRARDDSGTEILVVVDRVLAEAREQAVALKGIVADLTRQLTNEKQEPSTNRGGGGGIVDLAAIIASRSAQAKA